MMRFIKRNSTYIKSHVQLRTVLIEALKSTLIEHQGALYPATQNCERQH